MNCNEFSERVSDFVEGTAAERDRAALSEHADKCVPCALLARDMRTLRDRMARLPRAQPSAGFDFSLRSRILMEAIAERGLRRRAQGIFLSSVPRAALSMAAAALLLLGVASTFLESPFVAPLRPTPISLSSGPPPHQLQAVDRGTLRELTQAESYEISGRFYRARQDSMKPRVRGGHRPSDVSRVRRVTVRF